MLYSAPSPLSPFSPQPERLRMRREPGFTLNYWLCVFSFFSLLLNDRFGMVAIIGFLVPWVIIGLQNIRTAWQAVIRYWPLWLLPALVLLSVAWSEDPRGTLKADIELIPTIAIGIMAATCVRPRNLFAALLTALAAIAVLSVLTSLDELRYTADADAALNGLYNSKNQFATMMSILMLVSVACFIDKGQRPAFRALAALSLLGTPVLLYLGHSLGAIIAVMLTLILFVLLRSLRRLNKAMRQLIYVLVISVLIIGVTVPLLLDFSPASILIALGKDPTLTGRTYLWDHAMIYAAERPLTGTGYNAFWRLDNPEAQAMWYGSHVRAGAGFNFHNEYIEGLVELGVFGMLLYLWYMLALARRAFDCIFIKVLPPEQSFSFIMFIFYFTRSAVEVTLFHQFAIGMVMICLFWIYLQPVRLPPAPPAAPAGLYVPPQATIMSR